VVRLLPLLLPALAFGQPLAIPGSDQVVATEVGPPGPLAGVPVDFRCEARLSERHPLLRRQPGQDLLAVYTQDLLRAERDAAERGDPPPDAALEPTDAQLAAWFQGFACGRVWARVEAAGAHRQPSDVRLPAKAVLDVKLEDLNLEGSRIVEQRVGSTVMPVAVPHWSLSMSWSVRFQIAYSANDRAISTPSLDWAPRGGAEQDDYTPLRLEPLLEASLGRTFRDLPQLLVDEGRLGDLLFAMVDQPSGSPQELGVDGPLSEHFWMLLAPVAKVRHDALAFYLASPKTEPPARRELARWFLLNDSDLPLRRDALGWLMLQEPAVDSEDPLSDDVVNLAAWLLARDPSPRLRAEVVIALGGRRTPEVRDLLLRAANDDDRRASDPALSALKRFPAATTDEMNTVAADPAAPSMAPWTLALDGRVAMPASHPDESRLALAAAAGGPASDAWLERWARGGRVSGRMPWALGAWKLLLEHPTARVRREAIARITREDLPDARELLVVRVAEEPDPALRVLAIEGLGERPAEARGAAAALLLASRDGDPAVRLAATRALSAVPGTDVQQRLETLSRNDPDGKVRRFAKKALRGRS